MTTFTQKLYSKAPLAAEDFYRQTQLDRTLRYGKHTTLVCFYTNKAKPMTMGDRQDAEITADFHAARKQPQMVCAASCGRSACRTGCKLFD
jgi:hypothetical protein